MSDNVVTGNFPSSKRPVAPTGGDGHDGGMEARFKRIEDRLDTLGADVGAMKIDLAVVKSNYATREDMQKEFRALTWQLVAAILVANLLPALPGFLKAMHWMSP